MLLPFRPKVIFTDGGSSTIPFSSRRHSPSKDLDRMQFLKTRSSSSRPITAKSQESKLCVVPARITNVIMLPLSLYRKYVPCFQQLLKVQFVIHDCVDKVILFNNASHLLSARHTDPFSRTASTPFTILELPRSTCHLALTHGSFAG